MPTVVKNDPGQLISYHSLYFCVLYCILLHAFEHQTFNWLGVELAIVKKIVTGM